MVDVVDVVAVSAAMLKMLEGSGDDECAVSQTWTSYTADTRHTSEWEASRRCLEA